MLTFLGFAMVIAFMYLIMSKRLTALIALIPSRSSSPCLVASRRRSAR